jgi:branched-chain amino acid transport system permease protein
LASVIAWRLDRRTAARTVLMVMAGTAAVLGPVLGDSYTVYLLTQSFIYAALAVSLDLVWGYAGILDLGHAVWFGAGALAVGVMTTTVGPDGMVVAVHGGVGTYLIAVLLGVAASAAAATVLGAYCFSWRGSTRFYVAIVTLAVSVVCEALYLEQRWTGGDNGLFGFQVRQLDRVAWYYLCLALLGVVLGIGAVVARSDFGLLMRAIRDNEVRARHLGFRVDLLKTAILAGGAALAALVGGVYGAAVGLVSSPLFGFLFSTQIVVWVAIGGRGTLLGPVLGAIALELASSSLDRSFPDQWQLLVGLAFVAVVVFIPDGLLPPLGRLFERLTFGGRNRGLERSLVPMAPVMGKAPERGDVVARFSGVTFAYGALQVLRGVSMEVKRSELLCLIGPNGAGKSTLMALVGDGTMQHDGSIRFELDGLSAHRGRSVDHLARRGVIRKFQTPSLFESLTVAETLLLARHRGRLPSLWRRTSSIEVPAVVVELCQLTGLDRHLNVRASALPHGLQQALELAATVAAWPDLLLLDEPTAGLTAQERRVVGEVLRRLSREQGRTVVLIEHDLDFVDELADRVVVLQDGVVLADGSADEIKRSETVRQSYLGVSTS